MPEWSSDSKMYLKRIVDPLGLIEGRKVRVDSVKEAFNRIVDPLGLFTRAKKRS
jgi:hypothetical protein